MSTLGHFLKWRLGLASAQTQTTVAEREAIGRHAAGARFLAEIGVWHGVTTLVLRKAMAPTGTCFAIDPYPIGRLGVSFPQIIAHREVLKSNNGTICWVRDTGHQAALNPSIAKAEFDFLFIDGDHSYDGLKRDWEAWRSRMRPGGIVALHDSRSTPIRNIDGAGSVIYTEKIILKDPWFDLIDTVDSLSVVRRKIES